MDTNMLGIDYAVKLAYTAVDKSDASFIEKRSLLFSLYSFRCLFDGAEMTYLNPVLKKYGCSFAIRKEEHPFYAEHKAEFSRLISEGIPEIPYGGVFIDGSGDDDKLVRFDAGSELYNYFCAMDKLDEKFASVPEKLPLFNMAYNVVSLNTATDELKALFYLMVSYIILIDAPMEPDFYYPLKEKLISNETFAALLHSKYSLNVVDSVQEMWALDYPNILIDFLLPYVEWKNETNEKGLTREAERFQQWLAAGKFVDVYTGTEKLLNTFPDDDELLLLNVAARVSLLNVESEESRTKLLNETAAMLEGALSRPSQKKIFFIYYYGLVLIALKQPDAALDKFVEALELNPAFEPALLMKRALEDSLNKAKS